MRRVPDCRRPPNGRATGFTLLEVLVAVSLAGIGLVLAFAAISGAQRLSQKGFEHEAAIQLARGKLTEVLATGDYSLADEAGEYRYGGVAYGFKIEIRPLPLLKSPYDQRVRLPHALDEVTINVYWGPEGAQQHFALTEYRLIDPGRAGRQVQGDARAKPAAGGEQRK